jgi:transposase
MGKPYSEDLRVRVVRAGQHGGTIPEIAEQFGVSISSVVRFRRLHRETGSVSSAKIGGYKGYALAAHEDLIRQLLAEQPDIALAEIKAILANRECDCRSVVDLAISSSFEFALKKKVCGPPSKIGRMSPPHVRPCRSGSQGLIRSALSLSTKPASPRRLPVSTVGRRRVSGSPKAAARQLENHHLHRCAAP